MSGLGQVIIFASRLYAHRAGVAWDGHIRRDPMSLLELRTGRTDPYAIYERIRQHGTLVPNLRGGWVSASHRVCGSVLRDRRFGVALDGGQPGELDLSFLGMNPPDHTRLRQLAQPAFSPKAVAAYRGLIERTAGQLLDQAAAAGSFDLIADFAAPLPIAVITSLLGIPDADSASFSRYGAAIGSALDGITSLRHARQLQANDAELSRLFERLFELRRREPQDDIVSRLVASDQIAPGEWLPLCVLLLVAGFETTVNLIGNAAVALLAHPGQWRALRADPRTMASRAADETLRFDPPVQGTTRLALETLDLEGTTVHAGEPVTILIGGANRDPDVYDQPATFDIHRESAADHLAFSSGIHYCLGQPLARLEATIALQLLAERMPGLTRIGTIKRRNATTIRGPKRMPVSTGCRPA
jgi:hypothetical protein